MKLFAQYNRLTIPASVGIFIIGSCTFYFVLQYILINQMDLNLQMEREEIEMEIQEDAALPEELDFNQMWVAYTEMSTPLPTQFLSTEAVKQGTVLSVRQLRFPATVNGKSYQITISTPLEHTQHLLNVIILVTIVMIAFMLVIMFLINKNIVSRLWKPFYETIDKTARYDLMHEAPMALEDTEIDEFTLLNNSINKMTARAQKEYLSLKEFTVHAAHEMQTPLSVIRLKLDTLIQNEHGSNDNAVTILELERSVNKLSRLHRSLLFLTKVENRQFALNETVRLDKLIEEKCAELAELLSAKEINCVLSLVPVSVLFHTHLAETVVGNLIVNAIQYNIKGGEININLTDKKLTVSNTSSTGELDRTKVFQRFYRYNTAQGEGNGLGLSIIKQICDFAGYNIEYSHQAETHVFSIAWK
ncbi:hypothetical protein BH09BAC1_BH09BAC1_04270 [soil metagenome]